jgi:hypothetical protein
MKTKQLMLGMLACAALFVASCGDEPAGGYDDEEIFKEKLPVSVTFTSYEDGKFVGGTRMEFSYDEQSRITTSTSSLADSMGAVTEFVGSMTFTYAGDKLTKMIGSGVNDKGVKFTTTEMAEYPSAAQVRTIYVEEEDGVEVYRDTDVYELDAAKRLIARGNGSIRYTYGADGVLSKEEWFWNNSVDEVWAYTYDDKNGIYKNVNMPSWFIHPSLTLRGNIQHNAVFETYTTDYNNDEYTYEMEYDADDYPVKIKKTMKENSVAVARESVQTIVYNK